MSIRLPRRTTPPLQFLYPQSLKFWPLPLDQRRCESSARRTTKRLRTKTDSSFTPSSPSNITDHIILNPPSASPSPYHTPPAFLPPNDPRRIVLSSSYKAANPYHDESRKLPPEVRKNRQQEKRYHLGPAEIEQMRRLRQKDPWQWTRKALAERFQCSQFFAGMVGEHATKEGLRKKNFEEERIKDIRDRWGKRKTIAREDRARRKELWYKDQ